MRFASALTVLVVAIASGCGGSSHGAEPEPLDTTTTGALTVDWKVKGAANPSACVSAGAAVIEITVVTDANETLGTFEQLCSAFATSIVLTAGNYTASARLLDSARTALTTSMPIDEFTMHVKSELTVPIDFPPSAFVVRR